MSSVKSWVANCFNMSFDHPVFCERNESMNLSCQANTTCFFVVNQLNFSTSYAAKLLGGQKDVTTGHARSCNSISHTLLVVVDRSSINHSITRLQSPLHLAKRTIIQVKNPANFLHQDLNWLENISLSVDLGGLTFA